MSFPHLPASTQQLYSIYYAKSAGEIDLKLLVVYSENVFSKSSIYVGNKLKANLYHNSREIEQIFGRRPTVLTKLELTESLLMLQQVICQDL